MANDGSAYWYSRFVFERGLALIYLVAFVAAANQFVPLLGERGLLPVVRFTQYVPFRASPSLFFLWQSDTAFRIFILMASRRLQSDRFLTVDYRPEIYSPLGLDWIENNGMTSIILRHCPQLAPVLPRTASAFAPFRPLAG